MAHCPLCAATLSDTRALCPICGSALFVKKEEVPKKMKALPNRWPRRFALMAGLTLFAVWLLW